MKTHLGRRAELIASAEPGPAAARLLAEMSDEAVRSLARTASSTLAGRWSIVALGGWGAGSLLPESDLDLLVLTDVSGPRLKQFVEAVLYPLWDAGLEVGHQVRTPKEQLRAMRGDLKTRTAALTGRAIAGDEAWARQWLLSWAADAKRRSKRGLVELASRPRPGSPWSLVHDLKNDAGGRRDYDELTWTAATLTGEPVSGPEALTGLGVLAASESACLADAAHTIAATRWRLQRDGFGDTLGEEATAELGDAAEVVQRALGDTALMLERVRARVGSARWSAALEGGSLTPEEVFGALDCGDDGLAWLELAAHDGRLDALIPGFGRLMSVRRPGLGHHLTVGAHCLRTASLVDAADGDTALAHSRDSLLDLRLVRVAALVHDIGKLEGGAGHAERGAAQAAEAAVAFGLTTKDVRAASKLVTLHLALIETALRDDLDDEDAILRSAARIGDRALVAPLHLLTAADSRATGPATWTPWTASLVNTLVARLDSALSPGVDGVGVASRGERVRAEALAALEDSPGAERAFIETASLRYLSVHESAEVLRDAHLVASLLMSGGAPQIRTAVSVGPVPGTTSVTVAAVDQPRLLARIAGAMALAGLDILSVDAYGTTGHIALDSFVVQSSTGRAISQETFARFDRLVTMALADHLELAVRLAERRRHYPVRSSTPGRVRVEPGGWDTIVRVRGTDRPGLLHDLASAVSASDLDIRWARIHTVDGVALDTFHVIGPDGGRVDDPGVLGHLSMRLREAL